MKKVYTASVLSVVLCLSSCVKNPSGNSHIKRLAKAATPGQATVSAAKHLGVQSTWLHFTAYKTTAKVPVEGAFSGIQTGPLNAQAGIDMLEAIKGMTFSIPVSSLDTKNKGRNDKILENFFRKMIAAARITGSFGDFDRNEHKGSITVKMNGVSRVLPVAFSRDANTLEFIGTMHLAKWKALRALSFLNRACYELHKGADGISKTWSEVMIHGKITFSNYE